jgi:secreted PhoX family phosphatase
VSNDQETFESGDPADISSNNSGNRPFRDVLQANMSRRSVVRGGTVIAAAGFLGMAGAGVARAGDIDSGASVPSGARFGRPSRPLLGFTAVAPSQADTVVVPDGYYVETLIPWGTPIQPDGPAWKKDASNTAEEQAKQVGMHHDANCYFPIKRGRDENRHGVLVTNHEYTDNTLLYPDGNAVITQEKVNKALNAHGVSVVEIKLIRNRWEVVRSKYARRITGRTPVAFSGPVSANHPKLQANNPPMGTLNNCSYGETPWGTYLACEENFDSYFGTTDTTWVRSPDEARYGLTAAGFGYKWHEVDPRFDLAANPNEPNRFGWVVEIDPFNPHAKPVKRTALGRVKHEGATVAQSRGRVVVYCGDDQDGDYLYKFVSARPWRWLRAIGRSPLDHGTLYVAKFHDGGTGQWLPLAFGQGPLTAANGWQDQADVLIRTRQAADAVGATPLDRAEWITVHPRTSDVYMTLTNSTLPPVSAVNPRNPNPYGHIIRWQERAATIPRSPSRGRSSCSPATHSTTRPSSWPRRTFSARRTDCGSTTTVDCGSRPMSPTRRRTGPTGATTGSATTRCWWPTRERARCGGSWSGHAAPRSPVST